MAKKKQNITSLVLKAVAIGMGVSSLVLGLMGNTQVVTILTPIGLTCLAINAMDKEE